MEEKEILNKCPECIRLGEGNYTMITIQWSPFDCGIMECPRCGFIIDYRRDREEIK